MTTILWKRGINGQFTNPADWSSNSVPSAQDAVAIIVPSVFPGSYTVTVSANITIRSLEMVRAATLAISSGDKLTITDGTTAGETSAGTISVANGGALQLGGTFNNSGSIRLNASNRATTLAFAGNAVLNGGGEVVLSDNADNDISGVPSLPIFRLFAFLFPFSFPFSLFPFGTATLTNAANTIEGAGTIGTNLTLKNQSVIIGDGVNAALTLNTAGRAITNFGVIEGTTPEGVVIVSNVENSGTLEALGTNANLTLDGIVTNDPPGVIDAHGAVTASGAGAHIELSSAGITAGSLRLGAGTVAETVADSGASALTGVHVTGAGTLRANQLSTLDINNSAIATTMTLMSNGIGSALVVNGNVGAVTSTIDGGDIEFNGTSASNVTFTSGAVGTLKLDSSFTGTVSGLTGAVAQNFSNMFVFGDSTVDDGALQFLGQDLGDPEFYARLQNALANGGTDSPVGVGEMNVQYLASALGLTLTTAYTTGGVIGGGGTDYAISGAYNTADFGSGNDPGNGGLTNSFFQGSAQGNAAVLSTVQQLQAYLNSVHGVADPSAVYLISSGANDTAYARTTLENNPVAQQAYLTRQAQALATEIEALFDAGARHIVVNDVIHNDNISLLDYSKVLYADLNAAGIPYIKSDVHEMTQTVLANPTNYGFTSQTVSVNDPALIEPDPGPDPDPPDDDQNAWGLWAANTTTPQGGNVPLVDQYSYLKPPDNPQQPQISTEETHFFTDNEHLSDAGQRIQGNFDYNLISDDAIDLTNLTYSPATTTVSFSGTTTGGTLTVSNGAQSANISLLGNYLAAAFVTASDGNIGASGNTGTLVMDTTGSQQQILLAHAPH